MPDTKERYITILADGVLHEEVPEGTEGAKEREYETSSGETGKKYEITYPDLKNAHITDVGFHDGKFGTNLLITFENENGKVILAQGTATSFGEDLMKKLPSVNLSEKVTLVPYSFVDEQTGKPKRGINFYQGGQKLPDFFYTPSGVKGVKGTTKNGYPDSGEESKTWTKDQWRLFFLQARIFLAKYTEDNIIAKKFPKAADPFAPAPQQPATDYPDGDGISPADIPF